MLDNIPAWIWRLNPIAIYRSLQREYDMEVLWPMLYKSSHNLHHALIRMGMHMANDNAWHRPERELTNLERRMKNAVINAYALELAQEETA